jgi:predicted metal-binding integral membrane protein DUF2182/peptidase M20/M25/M40-like protein
MTQVNLFDPIRQSAQQSLRDPFLRGTTRALSPSVRDQIEPAIRRIAEGSCRACGAEMRLRYERRYPPTINSRRETERAATAAASLVGDDNVKLDLLPSMAAEDFACFLERKPGAYIWIGNGSDKSAAVLHNPHHDFNDAILPLGAIGCDSLKSAVLAGVLFIASGVYQLTPLKRACLRRCRSPLEFLGARHAREGAQRVDGERARVSCRPVSRHRQLKPAIEKGVNSHAEHHRAAKRHQQLAQQGRPQNKRQNDRRHATRKNEGHREQNAAVLKRARKIRRQHH